MQIHLCFKHSYTTTHIIWIYLWLNSAIIFCLLCGFVSVFMRDIFFLNDNEPLFDHAISYYTALPAVITLHLLPHAYPHIHTQSKQLHKHTQRFLFSLTSHSLCSPTFIVEVLPSLARLLLDGRPAVDHMHTPLHFHVLFALLERLNEKLPSISPDQTCLEKEGFKLAHPYSTGASNYSVPDQLEDLENSWIWGNDAGRHNLGPFKAFAKIYWVSPWFHPERDDG